MSMKPENDPAVTTCPNCHSPMPKELRFCRNCGFRLGEGPAEYIETVRFPNAPLGSAPGIGSAAFNPYGGAGGAISPYPPKAVGKRKRRMSGMTWMFLGLIIFFIAAAAFTAIIKPIAPRIATEISEPAAPRSYVGVDEFETTEGGVTFGNVEPPGSPADKAGLVGGDVITSFDGKQVTEEDEISNLLRTTPVGKTVDVVFIRDGEAKTTKLTTISKEEFDRLTREFRSRADGRGLFGYDDDETERVQIPGTKMFGVRLDEINPSMPADMAGIKQGDIVIEFDGVPIRTGDELLSRVRRAIPYSIVKVVVMRGEERVDIPVKIGKS